MSTLLDSRLHADAIKDAVSDALGQWVAYDYGEVPGSDGNEGTLPSIFALVTVERRFGGNLRSTARAGNIGWRTTVRVTGRTPDEARWALLRVAEALNEKRLVVLTETGPKPTTPIQFESEQTSEKDDGRYSALVSYTYVH